ncbi:MAG: PEP-CTERM sorting domain-containing protein [Acidobacteria bacterium]|nr:PEP-CTERM sorting domain-containing protein [Acidobacteriota bacterium]
MKRIIGVFCLLGYMPAWGATVSDFALGSQLAGSVVTVTRFGGAMPTATFVAAGTGASATFPGLFTLTVSPGDTGLATWVLTNTDPSPDAFFNRIGAVVIDLTLSGVSLFDSGALPSTPVSGPGIPGVTYVAGAPIGVVTEMLPWADPANTGDMHRAVHFTFPAFIGSGASSSWMDDTDVIDPVPEPASLLLVGVGLLLAVCKRRSHRTAPR